MLRAMIHRKPELQPREGRSGSIWHIHVTYVNWPFQQIGGFSSEQEAQKWIDQESRGWLRIAILAGTTLTN